MQQISQAYLFIQLGNRWTDILRLQPGQSIFVGRSSACNIVVKDERVSRKHAEFFPIDGGWAVQDLGSRNGTQVDGATLSDRHQLQEGETICVGSCRMKFTQDLVGGFGSADLAARRLSEADPQASFGSQQTKEIEPRILNRLSNSQWSSEAVDAAELAKPSAQVRREQLSFFYRLISELVTAGSPEAAAQKALNRLLDHLNLSAGGVLTFPTSTNSSSRDQRSSAPQMIVLATCQPEGGGYHRVSDFLVSAVKRDNQAVLARNVCDDSKLSVARDSGMREVISVICAPLRRVVGEQTNVTGLLHVYSLGNERMLSESDLELTVGVADNLSIALARQLENAELADSLEKTRRRVNQLEEQLDQSAVMVGQSRALEPVRRAIQRAGPTSATVLVRGESGVGKELVARAIHLASQRREAPLLCLNCAALAPTLLESELFGHEKGSFTGATERKIGKFEAAHGGTLLLDEIGEMSPELQAKFLRVLEGQPFERLGGNKPIHTDVRVIAATNRDLEEAVEKKEFRADLYFRLRVIEISVPPLRKRIEDIPLLVEHFLDQLRQHAGRRLSGVSPAAMELLTRHSWPGNVRELKNVIERAIVLGGSTAIEPEDLSLSPLDTSKLLPEPHTPEATGFRAISLAELEREQILATLDYTGGNKTKASQILGIERSTLDRKLKRYERS